MTRSAHIREHEEVRHCFPHRHYVDVIGHQSSVTTGEEVLRVNNKNKIKIIIKIIKYLQKLLNKETERRLHAK